MEFNDLPSEIQFKIFSLMSKSQLANVVALVCKRWFSFAYEPLFWTSMQYNDFHRDESVTSSTRYHDLERCPLLSQLTVKNFTIWRFVPHLMNCPYLKKLTLSVCSPIKTEQAKLLVKYCPLIEKFYLRRCEFEIFEIAAIKEIVKWKQLKELTLISGIRSTVNVEDCIVIIAKNCRNLEALTLKPFYFPSSRPMEILASYLRSKLKKLNINMNQSMHILTGFTCLSDLTIGSGSNLVDEDLSHLRNLKTLQKLLIYGLSDVTESGFSYLFQERSLLSGLQELSIYLCFNVKDSVVQAITECCSSLKVLDLSWYTSFTDKGIEFIAANCRNLRSLNVSDVHEITCACLKNYPMFLLHLTYLGVCHCPKVTPETIHEISTVNPKLTVKCS